jgi:tetratricopeptide (TPR) repeat protein
MSHARVRSVAQTALISLFLLVPSQAHSDTDGEDLAACQREADPALRVELCSKVASDKSEIEDIHAEALLNRGLAFSALGADDKAIADYTSAIALNPQYTALYQSRGEAYFRSGDAPKAIADFDAVLNIDAQNTLALHSRAAVHLHAGENDAAFADFAQLLTLDATDADAFAGRGLVFERKGDRAHAEADFRRAIEIEGENEVAAAGLQRLSGSL